MQSYQLINNSKVVYKFTCPGCKATYVGKTERNLYRRWKKHTTTKDSADNWSTLLIKETFIYI